MAKTIPLLTKANIQLPSPNYSNPKHDIPSFLLQAIENSKIDELSISNIFIINEFNAEQVLAQYAPGQLWMNNPAKLGMGKAVGFEINNSISNNLFFHNNLFQHIFNNSQYADIARYVPHHEFGHCYDHVRRGEIIPPLLQMPKGIFILDRVANYYLYIIKGEFSACFFSGYATFPGLIVRQLTVIQAHFHDHFHKINLTDPFLLADFVWFIMAEFSKIAGYRLGNLSLNSIRLLCPRFVHSDVFDILINEFEPFLINQMRSYPNFNQDFNTGCIDIFHNICAALGYRFRLSPTGDTLELIIP